VIKRKLCLITGLIPAVLALTTTGCATKSFVRAQIAPANSKIDTIEATAKEQADKEQADVSRVETRLASTDNRVAEAASAAERANAGAAQANQLAQEDQAAIAANQSAIAANAASIATLDKALNYSLVAKAEVNFAFNRSNLDKTDQAALDRLVQQAQSSPCLSCSASPILPARRPTTSS